MKTTTLITTALLAASILMTAGIARAAIGFQDYYAPANWTTTQVNSDGSVVSSGAPGQIQIIGPNNGSGLSGRIEFTILAPAAGTVGFHWSYGSAVDAFAQDHSGYVINGALTQIAATTANQTYLQGDVSFSVNPGDTFGFYADSTDNRFGAGDLTISSFTAPVPEPVHLALSVFGIVFGSVGLCRLVLKKGCGRIP